MQLKIRKKIKFVETEICSIKFFVVLRIHE